MINYIVVAMDIKTGKSHRASVELDTRQEAEAQVAYLVKLAVPGFQANLGQERRYRYSIMEYEVTECPNHCCWEGQASCESEPCPLAGNETEDGGFEVVWDSRLPKRYCGIHGMSYRCTQNLGY